MKCDRCATENVNDARFCHRCGSKFVTTDAAPVDPAMRPGEIRGPGYTRAGEDPSASISLGRLGVVSPSRAWAMFGAAALGFLTAGAVLAWLWMNQRPRESAQSTPASPSIEPAQIGDPIPLGAAPPAEPPEAAAARLARERLGNTPAATRTRARRERDAPEAPPAMTSSSSPQPVMEARPPTAPGPGAPPEEGATEAAAATATAEPQGAPPNAPAIAEAATAPSDDEPVPDERDIAMELYGAQVRSVIRRFYAPRAQACFEHASRNEENVRGVVQVAFTIGTDGHVSDASTQRNSTGLESLAACLVNQVRSWRLPAPPDGPVELAIPFSR